MTDVEPVDHRYLQVARALRKDIVDGVYPVGSQLPTRHSSDSPQGPSPPA